MLIDFFLKMQNIIEIETDIWLQFDKCIGIKKLQNIPYTQNCLLKLFI